jgi:hypothetical protein
MFKPPVIVVASDLTPVFTGVVFYQAKWKSRMNKKWHLWRWLALVSILVGILLAMFLPTLNGSSCPGDFEWHAILLRFFSTGPLCFFAFGLLLILLKLAQNIFRWLFSWRGVKWSARVLAFLAILLALFYAEEDWRGGRAWKNCQRELATKGENLDFVYFVPPPVPDDQNFALTPIVASCYSRVLDRNGRCVEPPDTNVVNRLAMTVYRYDYNGTTNQRPNSWQRGDFTDLKAWQDYYRTTGITNFYGMPGMPPRWPGSGIVRQTLTNDTGFVTNVEIRLLATNIFPVTPAPQSPAADVLFALSKYDSAIEELRQASRLPYSRFPLDYMTSPDYEVRIPHLETIRNCAQVLSLRSVAELADGQSEKAFADVELIVYLANSIRDEPLSNSQMVRVAILNFALQPVWEGLAKHQWSDVQLVALERELSKFDFLSGYQLMVRADRTFAIALIADIMQKQNVRELFAGLRADADDDSLDWHDLVKTGFFFSMPRGWFYLNEYFVTCAFQQSLLTDEEIRGQIISPSEVRRSADIIMDEFKRRSFYEVFASGVFPPLYLNVERMTYGQASRDLARTACALERYRLAHGEYPETLDALVPQFSEKLPHDIINGQPLHYRRTADGKFLLYSVGWNETDDDGTPEVRPTFFQSRPTGDWVWQYPQK